MAIITITGSVVLPDGNGPSGGVIIATLSSNATRGSNRVLGRKVFRVPDGGNLALISPSATIEGNDDLTPTGTYYEADYRLIDRDGTVHPKRELWQLAGSGSQSIADFAIDVPVPPLEFGDGAVPQVASLPTADASYAGRFRRVKAVGGPTTVYICLPNSAGGYEWVAWSGSS